jgi:hypothetical protein
MRLLQPPDASPLWASKYSLRHPVVPFAFNVRIPLIFLYLYTLYCPSLQDVQTNYVRKTVQFLNVIKMDV